MRINEILTESQMDEVTADQVGRGIGKVAGNVVRGTKDFFSGIKSGYQQGKSGQPAQPQPSNSSAPATNAGTGTASGSSTSGTASGSGSNVKFSSGPTAISAGDSLDPDSLENIKGLVAKLNPTQKQEIAKAIEQGTGSSSSTSGDSPQGSTANAGSRAFGQMASQLTPPSTSSTGGTTTQTPTGVKHTANPNNPNQPKSASAASSVTPDTSGLGTMRQFMNTVTPDQSASSGTQTSPDVASDADAAKLTKQQQDAKKAELLSRRQSGASTATQTGGGFQNYVAGSGERMTGVDDQGAPVFKKIQREATFKSKFLEMDI